MKARIMLVDDNTEFTTEVKQYLEGSEKYELVKICDDGVKAADSFAVVAPDLLILDLVMPNMDGFSVLEKINKGNCRVIVLSALSQDSFITKAIALGADYYMMKPVSLPNLFMRVDECLAGRGQAAQPPQNTKQRIIKNKSLEEKITNIFITVGIPAHIKGYQFLREAIKMAIDSPDIINSITKRLYPDVAEKFDTSPSKVERAIRHAIEVAWNRGKIENINSLFGVRVYNHNEKPTNGEFIALVADKMLLESV